MPNSKMKIMIAAAFTAFALEATAAETPAAAKPAAPAPAAAAAAPSTAAAPAAAPAAKSDGANCEDIKASIDAKIKAKGVKAFTLEIVGKDEVKDAKVVGNCEAGAKRITYKRG